MICKKHLLLTNKIIIIESNIKNETSILLRFTPRISRK